MNGRTTHPTRSTQALCARCGCRAMSRPLRRADLSLGHHTKWAQRGHGMVGVGDSGEAYIVVPKLQRGYTRKGREVRWELKNRGGKVLGVFYDTGSAMEAADAREAEIFGRSSRRRSA